MESRSPRSPAIQTLLIAPLDKSGHLKDVHFFAPTTRGADGTRFMFHIEARVEPHPKIAGD